MNELNRAIEAQRAKNPKKIDPVAWMLKLVFSRVGPMITGLVSMTLGFVVTQLAQFNIVMTAEVQLQLSGFVSFVVWGAIQQAVNHYAGKYAEMIQTALGLEPDRWIGPKTAAEIQAAASKAKPAEPVE